MKRTVLIFAAVGLLAITASVLAWIQWGADDPYRPPWEFAQPESQGMDGSMLRRLRQTLAQHDTRALLIMRNGKIVQEWYPGLLGRPEWYPGLLRRPEWYRGLLDRTSRRYGTASLAKALVGGLSIALAMCDGVIGLDDPARAYIPAWRNDPRKAQITIRHLMTHSSGLPHRIHGPPADVVDRALHEEPVLFDPGSGYAYSGSAYAALAYALTAALQQTPHRDILELLRKRIMTPLGVPDADWSIGYRTSVEMDGMVLYAPWGGGSYTARATARIGQMLLQRGMWNGEPLLREDCIDRTVSFGDTPLADAWREWHYPAPAAGWWSNSEGELGRLYRRTHLRELAPVIKYFSSCQASSLSSFDLEESSDRLIGVVISGSRLNDFCSNPLYKPSDEISDAPQNTWPVTARDRTPDLLRRIVPRTARPYRRP